jgi:hypothetical protein
LGTGPTTPYCKKQAFYRFKGIISAVKRVELISERMLYVKVKGQCNDTVLNMHIPPENKTDDVNDRFYEEQECVFDHFQKYHMKILL